ncbi:MAG TPA: universal stress protein [Thermoleophilaceae bacterium]
MYRKILVGYDDSDQAKDALALGRQIADATGAELVLAGVSQFDPVWRDWDPHFRDADAEFADELRAAAKAAGAEMEHVPSSSPARGLHDVAERTHADLIVVGSSHHGRLGRSLAGGTGMALLHGAPCAVGIAPHGYRDRAGNGIAGVTLGFDGSEEAGHALMAASRLARDAKVPLRLISVAVPPPRTVGKGGETGWHALLEAIEEQARGRISEARQAVPDGVEVEATLISGDPVEALAGSADRPGTVMVIGSRGYGPLRRVLLGSVSTPLVRSASCPVIVTPRGMHEHSPDEAATVVGTAS